MARHPVRIEKRNNTFQHVETLKRNRKRRYQAREFFVEGVRSINTAREKGWKLTCLLYDGDRQLSKWGARLVSENDPKKTFELSSELMGELSEKDESSELVALFQMPKDDFGRIPIHAEATFVVFDRPASPGNLGSSIRSCDAFGVDGIIVTGHAVDPYDPKVLRSSMGSFFSVPIVRAASTKKVLEWLSSLAAVIGPVQCLGTSAKAERSIDAFGFSSPFCLLIGNEADGLAQAYLDACDMLLRIPMVGSASSLNASCALSILLYKATQDRG